jgi:deoxyinosine 3'endonuclease (endonuclease V)
METGGRPDRGVCAAVDVHYLSTGGARAAAVLAADAAFAHVLAEHTAVVPRVAPYRPSEFYLRELPPLRPVLQDLSGLGLLVVDGYADLDPAGRPGLGAHAHAEFGIPVIGVAKSRFRTATHALPVLRILSPPAVRHLRRDARSRCSGPGPAHGRPVPAARRTAPRRHPRADRSARSHHDRPPARLTYADARNAADPDIHPKDGDV